MKMECVKTLNTFNIISVIRLYNHERTEILDEIFLTKSGTLYEFKDNTLVIVQKVFDITGKELLKLYNDNIAEYFSAKYGIVEIDDKSISDVLMKYNLYGKNV